MLYNAATPGVTPVKTGAGSSAVMTLFYLWIPAFAGMTLVVVF